jgi:hypothetical protein
MSIVSSTIHAKFEGKESPDMLTKILLMIPTLLGIYDAAVLLSKLSEQFILARNKP